MSNLVDARAIRVFNRTALPQWRKERLGRLIDASCFDTPYRHDQKTGMAPEQLTTRLDALQHADTNLAPAEDLLRVAYGRSWLARSVALRRQIRGLREEVRRRYLEQQVEQRLA